MSPPRLDRFVSVHLVAPMLRGSAGASAGGIPILMYHSVSDDPEPGVRPYYRLATPPALFRDHLSVLADEGFTVVSLPEAVEALDRPIGKDRRLAVITFDDGFRDFLTHAWPALADRAFPATVFLPTDYIGHPRRSFVGRECLTWDEVRDLRSSGVLFGSHTVTHPKLESLDDAGLQDELSRSRTILEDQLREPVDTFCHPYGFPAANRDYVRRLRALLLSTGYSISTTTNVGRATAASDRLTLPRLPVNGADDVRLFAAKLRGAYDWTARPQALFKRVKRALRSFA